MTDNLFWSNNIDRFLSFFSYFFYVIRRVKHYYTFLLSTICLSAPGYSQIDTAQTHAFPGIKNWDEVVAKAKADNKCIMVDLSTEWCK